MNFLSNQVDLFETRTEALDMAEELISLGKEAVEEHPLHTCSPTAVGISGNMTHHYMLSWSSEEEKAVVFGKLNEDLRKQEAYAVVLLFSATRIDKASGDREDTIVCMTLAHDFKQMEIFPYTINPDDTVDWKEPSVEHEFTTSLVSLPDRGV